MDASEIEVVAQAITDAHARKSGLDCAGRLDDAKTIIAALDALQSHRATRDKAIARAVAGISIKAQAPEPEPVAQDVAPPATPDAAPAAQEAPAPAATNVTSMKPKTKGKK